MKHSVSLFQAHELRFVRLGSCSRNWTILKGENKMETIELYDFQLDFIKELLNAHFRDKNSDRDTRLMATNVLGMIEAQVPAKVDEVSLLTGELIAISVDEGR